MKNKSEILAKLQEFEIALNPAKPEKQNVRIVGYGEMSTVFRFLEAGWNDYVYKRMALFHTAEEADKYEQDFYLYHQKLKEWEIETPEHNCYRVKGKQGEIVLYLQQKMLVPETIGHKFIHTATEIDIQQFFLKIMDKFEKFWQYNNNSQEWMLGLDGQLSNWTTNMIYLDTSTPLMRHLGQEQLNPELFLRICPKSLRWIIRLFFLKNVLNRYYDIRLVIIDLIANLNKEQRPDLIPVFINLSNDFMREKNLNWKDISLKEIKSYYKEDAQIWRIFLFFRRMERFFMQLRGKTYPMILPGKIRR